MGELHMQNIHELIGLVQGVNFDEIINDKEVVRLQTWVAKNRNLAYDHEQVKLIQLLDKVLEDQIITFEEKEEVLEFCNKFIGLETDKIEKVFELNGIIEGIICDGIVNEAEVHRLRSWMKENDSLIRSYQFAKTIYSIIGDVLEDDIITQQEQEELLALLSENINGSRFETKFKNLKERVKSRKNIGVDLIDLLDNENAIDIIHKRAVSELRKSLNSYSGFDCKDREIVFISLVIIAMLYYSEGNFYDGVREIYETLYKDYSEQKIEGTIRTILSSYRRAEKNSQRTRTINVALSNAIVPSNYLKSFFDFIYDIYKLNFEHTLSDDLYKDFEFVYKGLRDTMKSEGDEVQISVTKKTYKLIKTTKDLIADEKQTEPIINLSIIVVRLIDKYIWNKECYVINPYLKLGYDEWSKTVSENLLTGHRRTKKETIRSRWEPYFYLNNNCVSIIPPIHRINAQNDYRMVKVLVEENGNIIYENNRPEIREIIGGYQIKLEKIVLEKPLGNIRYKVLVGDQILYDSKEKLYRKFLFFDEKGHEILNNTDYSGTVILCTEKEQKDFIPYHKIDNYFLSSKSVQMGEAYLIGDMIFNFSSLVKPGLIGDELKEYFIKPKESTLKLSVYRQIKYLVFEYDSAVSNYEILLDSCKNKLEDFDSSKTSRKGIDKYIVNLDCLKDGIHNIEVFAVGSGKRERIYKSNFAVDSLLEVNLEKFDKETYLITTISTFLNGSITKEITPSTYNDGWLSFICQGREYIYGIPLNLDFYRISDGHWTPFEDEIWIKDISQNSLLDICGCEINGIQIMANGRMITDVIPLKNKGIFSQTSVGFLASYTTYEYVIIILLKDGICKKTIYCYYKCVLDTKKTKIEYNPIEGNIAITPYYFGNGKVYLRIQNKFDEEIYKSESLIKGVSVEISGLTSFIEYKISFLEKPKGLSLQKERCMKEYNEIFYARKDFVGRKFKIKEVEFDQLIGNSFVRKTHFFNNVYVRFLKFISNDKFLGEVFNKTSKGIYKLYNLNPVEIEICSGVVDGCIVLSITKDGDGLLLDFKHHGIMNTLEDKRSVDIFSYTIDLDNGK